MKAITLTLAILMPHAIMGSDVDWTAILSDPTPTLSSEDIKAAAYAYAKINNWLKESLEVQDSEKLAYALMKGKTIGEIALLVSFIDLDIIQQRLTREIEGQRELVRLNIIDRKRIPDLTQENDKGVIRLMAIREKIFNDITRQRKNAETTPVRAEDVTP